MGETSNPIDKYCEVVKTLHEVHVCLLVSAERTLTLSILVTGILTNGFLSEE